MVHTFELSISMSRSRFVQCALAFGFTPEEIQRIEVSHEEEKNEISSPPQPYCEGITLVTLHHDYWKAMMETFYICLKVEPQRLIEGRRTVDLFLPTEGNKKLLVSKFYDSMGEILAGTEFDYLRDISAWRTYRVDYTKNLLFSSEEEADHFFLLTKRTSRYIRRHQIRMKNCIDSKTGKKDKLESCAERNKSSKGLFYKKTKQIEEVYENIPDHEKKRLIQEARHIVRFEVQCESGKISNLKKKYGIKDRSIIHFLDLDIAQDILEKTYLQMIGEGDFYSLYRAQKRIESSTYSKVKKQRLIDTMRLIAQSRGVYKAREKIEQGSNIKNMDICLQCTGKTFDTRLKEIKKIGLNPVLLPKEWGVIFLKNPIEQIRCTDLYGC